jgi:hypothetical protein
MGACPLIDYSEQGRRFHRPRPTFSPPRPELLPVLPHNRSRRLQTDPDTASFVDVGALDGNAPDDILSGQYRCHLPPP